jgi:protein-L-isoaspartate(D-aspartate) O-methyltransferase
VSNWRVHAAAYADRLVADGHIADASWQRVFAATPRQLFIPRFWALDEYNSPASLVDGGNPDHRDMWLDAIYSDRFLITQWASSTLADGHPIRVVTSSASQPCAVTVMLDRLAVRDGDRVLEIGTGTGYNSALLCARLGHDRVTRIDIDPSLIEQARANLRAAGYQPRLHTGDGSSGVSDAAPFDRIIATCSVDRIPTAWIAQLAPQGRLVAPPSFGAALAVLDKTDPDRAAGKLDPFRVSFMAMRDSMEQPMPDRIAPELPPLDPDASHHVRTDVDPRTLNDPDFQFWLALHLPGVTLAPGYTDGRQTNITAYTARERATADLDPDGDGRWPVQQQGRRPWDTVEVAWLAWQQAGRPARHRLGLTVHGDGRQFVWLDHPTSPTWCRPLPGMAGQQGHDQRIGSETVI